MHHSSLPTAFSGVTVCIARDPGLVRTVRLVAAAMARRIGRDDDFVEEVRLAVGEACAVLLGPHPDAGSSGPVTVAMQVDDGLAVDVSSHGSVPVPDAGRGPLGAAEPWALLCGLIENVRVHQEGATTRVSMSWPGP